MERYVEVCDNLQKSINEKGQVLLFSQSIRELKLSFSEDISTKFLIGLSDLKDNKKKSQRIKYLLRRSELKTKRTYNTYKIQGVSKYRTDVIVWGHDEKNKPFPEVVGLTDNERRQIAEIKELSENTGINLFNHAKAEHSDRQKQRNAFNCGGGAVVRDVRVIQVGNFAVMRRQEVLYMVIVD